jgi:hypothetical protein
VTEGKSRRKRKKKKRSIIYLLSHCTLRCSRASNSPTSCPRGPRFKFRPGDRLSWLRFLWFSVVLSRKCRSITTIWKSATIELWGVEAASLWCWFGSVWISHIGPLKDDLKCYHFTLDQVLKEVVWSKTFFLMAFRSLWTSGISMLKSTG